MNASSADINIHELIDGLRRELSAPSEGILKIEELCSLAEEATQAKKGVPKILHPLFRNQGRYNDQILKALRLMIQEVRDLKAHPSRRNS